MVVVLGTLRQWEAIYEGHVGSSGIWGPGLDPFHLGIGYWSFCSLNSINRTVLSNYIECEKQKTGLRGQSLNVPKSTPETYLLQFCFLRIQERQSHRMTDLFIQVDQ